MVLARKVAPNTVPFIFVTCGEQEGLLPSNRQFAAVLAQRNFRFEFHPGPGSHDWNQWNRLLSNMFAILFSHILIR